MAAIPKIIVLSENFKGKKLHELTKPVYNIGRVEECDVHLPDTTVSTNHCELNRGEDGGYTAKDMGSSNGTRINGVRITEQKLNHSDILQVGGIEILYHFEDDSLVAGQNAQTGINLEDTAGGLQIQDLGNVNPLSKGGKKDSGKKAAIAIYGLIIIMVIFVIVLGGGLVLKMLK